jgi:hypothetical protein
VGRQSPLVLDNCTHSSLGVKPGSGVGRQKARARQLLIEVEGQKAALAELPDKYEFPLFHGRPEVESQRKSGCGNKTCEGAWYKHCP